MPSPTLAHPAASSHTTPAPLSPPTPLAPDIRSHWTLDPSVAFLNHGSFGACPREVLAEQQRLRDELEREPLLFLDRTRDGRLDQALTAVGAFIGATRGNLGFVTNATEGCAAVIRSIDLKPGDELLTTAHAYDAISFTLQHVADRAGAKVIRVPIDTPYVGDDRFVSLIDSAITPRTRLVVVDHITSVSALVLPVKAIVERCAAHGVDVLIDGAHAPGMIDLNVEALGAAWYAGNLHKWVCAPKGAGFLHARPDRQRNLHPAIVSNHYGQGFAAEFNWQGTRDITPWLAAPKAIEFMGRLGWDRVRAHNHQMAAWAQRLLCEKWGVEPLSALDGSSLGSMASVPLPPRVAARYADRGECVRELFERFRIEIPGMVVNGLLTLRLSCQVYNRAEEYEKLADVVAGLGEVSGGVH